LKNFTVPTAIAISLVKLLTGTFPGKHRFSRETADIRRDSGGSKRDATRIDGRYMGDFHRKANGECRNGNYVSALTGALVRAVTFAPRMNASMTLESEAASSRSSTADA